MVASVAPLVFRPQQERTVWRQALGLVEELFKASKRVAARKRKTVERVVKPDDLAGEQLAIALQRLGDAARIVKRADDDARGLAGMGARTPPPLKMYLHARYMPQVGADENVASAALCTRMRPLPPV